VLEHVRALLIEPMCQLRAWDYGAVGDAYPCWLTLAHRPSNVGIAYCESGFGPRNPWGLLFIDGTEHMSMGIDSGWYSRFLQAYFESPAATELPIWRVFESRAPASLGVAITDEDTWENTWSEVYRLRHANPQLRYDCSQSVYVGAA